jgi:hypothetical protein
MVGLFYSLAVVPAKIHAYHSPITDQWKSKIKPLGRKSDAPRQEGRGSILALLLKFNKWDRQQ